MKTLALFNNKGGVGKTTLVYHLGWMLSLTGHRVLLADFDPQANLTSMIVSENDIEHLWDEKAKPATVSSALSPIRKGTGDIKPVELVDVNETMWLVPGDLSLSEFEDSLSENWPKCLDGDERAWRVSTSLYRMIDEAARRKNVDIVLIDVGPNLGAINRAALISADYVLVPMSADLFSIKGLANVGRKLGEWRAAWQQRLQNKPVDLDFNVPSGHMTPLGYVFSRHNVRSRGPVKSYRRWMDRAPAVFKDEVLKLPASQPIDSHLYLLARLKDYFSLSAMAQEARKPMFMLKPADGAIGGHQNAVIECRNDFEQLAKEIETRINDRRGV